MDVVLVDCSDYSFEDQLTILSIQGIVNRLSPRLFLDFGYYDDPDARKTNEDFLPEEIWQEKFRPFIGRQDIENLTYYQNKFSFTIDPLNHLPDIIRYFMDEIQGVVVWDAQMEDTINPAMMLAGLENLLVVSRLQLDSLQDEFGFEVVHNLCDQWTDRVSLYTWAFENLHERCQAGKIACIEPGWHRPEFYDMVVKEQVFTYSLSSQFPCGLGGKLIFLLLGGPTWLRNFLFELHLDRPVKWLAKVLMSRKSSELKLTNRIQQKTAQTPNATIFGWHTRRDDEFAFMALLSANNLRLVPSHMAANFSFHSALPGSIQFEQPHIPNHKVVLEKDKTYLTFTLSDGDQLMMMNTAELGNWRRAERGKIPFNWEVQPLLAEFAPALYEQYIHQLTPSDLLIAGPSGAGYMIPPLHGKLQSYFSESTDVCRRAGIRVVTSYYPDPPNSVIRQHMQTSSWFLGFLSGYFFMKEKPAYCRNGRSFLCNAWPPIDQIGVNSEEVFEGVRRIIEEPGKLPRFIGVHLFAYRTTISDVYDFVQSLDPEKVKVVRGDEFLIAASSALCKNKNKLECNHE